MNLCRLRRIERAGSSSCRIAMLSFRGSEKEFLGCQQCLVFPCTFCDSFRSGYTATMDFPMNLFASSMAQRRPSSKVIMTVRPEEEWLSSWANINDIMSLLVARPWTWLVDMTFNQRLLKAGFAGFAGSKSFPAVNRNVGI